MKEQYVNEILHRQICRMDKNYISTVWGSGVRYLVLGTPRLTALKLFPRTAFSSDHNNNLKWAILGTKCACLLPRKDFFNRA